MRKISRLTIEPLSLFPEDEVKPAHDETVYNHDALFMRLAKSDFRSKFHLRKQELDYIDSRGMEAVRKHAADFVASRLAPAFIPNDGRQTPMRGHPVFIAQHATACCCRFCFEKWHHVPRGRELTDSEQNYAVSVLMTWIEMEYEKRRGVTDSDTPQR